MFVCVAFLVTTLFSSCSKEEVDPSLLIGKWKSVYRYAWVEKNWNGKSENNREYDKAYFIFKPNNKCDFYDPESIFGYTSRIYNDVNWGKSPEYEYGIFIIDEGLNRIIFVKKVTSKKMVIVESWAYNDGYNYEEFHEETIFEKVLE